MDNFLFKTYNLFLYILEGKTDELKKYPNTR